MGFNRGSLNRLTDRSRELFPEPTLFGELGRTLCDAGCLPRKELFEAWEFAKRVRRRLRGGRVVDLACGHGLLAYVMLLIDGTSTEAIAVDANIPPSAARIAEVIEARWPRLAGRVTRQQTDLDACELGPDDVVVSVHACGGITDRVLSRAVQARARVAVLPCCHSHDKLDQGGLGGWLDPSLAIDVTRAATLVAAGYRIHTHRIPEDITPMNRILIGQPRKDHQ